MTTTHKGETMLRQIDELIHDFDVATDVTHVALEGRKHPEIYRSIFSEIGEVASIATLIIEAWEKCEKLEKDRERMTEQQKKKHEQNMYRLLQASRSWHKKAKELIKSFNSFPTP